MLLRIILQTTLYYTLLYQSQLRQRQMTCFILLNVNTKEHAYASLRRKYKFRL